MSPRPSEETKIKIKLMKKIKNLKKEETYESYMDPTRYKEKMSISKTKSVLPYIRPVYGDNIDPLASIESALSLLITTSALNGHDSYQVLREPV